MYKFTNPQIFTKYFKDFGLKNGDSKQVLDGNVHIYPKEYFNPKSYDGQNNKFTENTCIVHHFDASWTAIDEKMAIWFIRHKMGFMAKYVFRISEKIKWFKKNIEKWSNKKLAVFCCGASPVENPDIERDLPKNFTQDELKKFRWFYCPGGLDYDKMSVTSKTMMKMLLKSLESKKDKTEKDIEQIKMISSSYDISDIKYIDPIVDYINS